MAGFLSGLGAALTGAGRGLSALKTPAERERERLQNEALARTGELSQLQIAQATGAMERQKREAEAKAQAQQQAQDFIGGFQGDMAGARQMGGFEPTTGRQFESGQAAIGITDPTQLGTDRREISEEEFKQRQLSERLGGGVAPSQVFAERLTQAPIDVSTSPDVQNFGKILAGAEPEQVSALEKAKVDKIEAEIKKIDVGAKKIQQDMDLAVKQATKENDTYKPSQYIVGTYALRMEQAQKELAELEDLGFNPSDFKNALMNKEAFNKVRDPRQRRYAQALRNFVNATLRRESGAAIAPTEFDSANKQYFAEFGDDSETLAQKERNRIATLSGFQSEAGGALDIINQSFQENLAKREATKGTKTNISIKGQDQEAINWLKANPNDPMADAVRQKLQRKGVL